MNKLASLKDEMQTLRSASLFILIFSPQLLSFSRDASHEIVRVLPSTP